MRSILTFLWLLSLYSAVSFCQESAVTNDNTLLLQDNPLSIWDVQLNINVTGNGAIKDGSFFYVTDRFSNLIRAYNSSGNLLYIFAIPGVSNLKDLAFDGTFEYGANADNLIYQMNFPTQTFIGTISTPISVGYLAYDYNNDAFWIGDVNPPLLLISRSGQVLDTLNNIQFPVMSGLAYDGESPGGPYLWLYAGIDMDSIKIYQIKISSGTLTGVQHNVLSDIGLGQTGASPGGLFFMDQYIPNTSSLGGILVGNPTKLFVYEINDAVPVEFVSFKGECQGNDVVLNWSTATETNNRGFAIQRSSGDQDFVTIGFIKGNGTTTQRHDYSYIDKNLNRVAYSYRLKQDDYNGSFHYSDVVNVDFNFPLKFALEQNFPNPFNPVTTINYQLPEPGRVTLKVFDILGREAASLVDDGETAGSYSINFDASSLAGGVYIYQLRMNGFSLSRKMLVLK